VKTYLQCPLKFKLRFVDEIPVDIKATALIRGNEIHQLLEDFYKPKTNDLNILAEKIKEHKYYEPHKDAVKNFIAFNKRIQEKYNGNCRPCHTEVKIHNLDLNVNGVIDRVDFDGKSHAIIDYKTGKIRNMSEYRFELAIYTILFEEEYNKKVTHWGVYFVDHDEFILEEVSPMEILNAKALVHKTREKILNKEFPKKPSYLCRWCECALNTDEDGIPYCMGEYE